MKPRATKTKRAVPGGSSPPAFTRIDLLCVVLAIALIGLVQLSALAQSASRSHAAVCFENLRRLAQGWMMYSEDNGGKLVPNCDGGISGKTSGTPSWVAGWLDYTASLDNVETRFLVDPTYLYGGKLGPYVLRDERVFRCPADTSTTMLFNRLYSRVRSVSMNAWMGGNRKWSGNETFQLFRATSQFTKLAPAQLWVIIDERADSINDANFPIQMLSDVMIDYPASYHAGGANLAFADGHVEYWAWRDPRTNPDLVPGSLIPLVVNQPGSADLPRLRAASTYNAWPP